MLHLKHTADEKHKSIGSLQSSGAKLKQKILDLSARKEALLAELKEVKEALAHAKQRGKSAARCNQGPPTRERHPSPQSTGDEKEAQTSGGLYRRGR